MCNHGVLTSGGSLLLGKHTYAPQDASLLLEKLQAAEDKEASAREQLALLKHNLLVRRLPRHMHIGTSDHTPPTPEQTQEQLTDTQGALAESKASEKAELEYKLAESKAKLAQAEGDKLTILVRLAWLRLPTIAECACACDRQSGDFASLTCSCHKPMPHVGPPPLPNPTPGGLVRIPIAGGSHEEGAGSAQPAQVPAAGQHAPPTLRPAAAARVIVHEIATG